MTALGAAAAPAAMRRALLLGAATLLWLAGASTDDRQTIFEPHGEAPGAAPDKQRRALAKATPVWPGVAVVNDVAGHFEVLAGVLAVLHQLRVRPHVYLAGDLKDLHLTTWLGPAHPEPTHWHALKDAGNVTNAAGRPVPLVVCVSAELAPHVGARRDRAGWGVGHGPAK